MKYYIYFDAYGHPRKTISASELAKTYQNDPDVFLQSMCRPTIDGETDTISGHVGTLSFNDDKELADYLDSLGDEIDGFYEAKGDSRPYNF